jgi:hypothetical protein
MGAVFFQKVRSLLGLFLLLCLAYVVYSSDLGQVDRRIELGDQQWDDAHATGFKVPIEVCVSSHVLTSAGEGFEQQRAIQGEPLDSLLICLLPFHTSSRRCSILLESPSTTSP